MPTQKRKVPALKGTGPKPWTRAEEDFVRKNYTKLTDKEMAATLGRGLGGVTWKRTQLGLPKEPGYGALQHLSGKPAPASSPADDEPFIPPHKSVWQRIADWWNNR